MLESSVLYLPLYQEFTVTQQQPLLQSTIALDCRALWHVLSLLLVVVPWLADKCDKDIDIATVTTPYTDTRYNDILDVMTRRFGTKNCTLTAMVPLEIWVVSTQCSDKLLFLPLSLLVRNTGATSRNHCSCDKSCAVQGLQARQAALVIQSMRGLCAAQELDWCIAADWPMQCWDSACGACHWSCSFQLPARQPGQLSASPLLSDTLQLYCVDPEALNQFIAADWPMQCWDSSCLWSCSLQLPARQSVWLCASPLVKHTLSAEHVQFVVFVDVLWRNLRMIYTSANKLIWVK